MDNTDLEFVKALVSLLEQPIAIVCTDGRLACDAPELSLALGLPQALTKGDHLCSALHEDVQVRLAAVLERSAETDAPVREQVESASALQLKLTCQRVFVPSGRFVLLLRFAANAMAGGAGLHYLLEHLEQGVWNYNVKTNRFTVSDAWRRMRGLDEIEVGEIGGEAGMARIHPEDRKRLLSVFFRQISGESEHIDVQYRHKAENNRWLWFQCRAKIVSRDPNGKPALIVGIDTDISALKEKEFARFEMVNKFQLAIGVAGIGLWEFNGETDKVFWDDRLLEIYGVEDGMNERPGDLWETYLHPDDRDKTIKAIDKAFAANREFCYDYRIVRPSGEIRHLRSAARCITDKGMKGKMVGVNIDVTEDYRRAEELERARKALEYDSRHDALTGLGNRRLLDETTHEMIETQDAGTCFGILHIDLDYFKQINDTLGHAAGDAVLLHVADVLRGCVEDDTLICRTGGDEFVLLVQDAPTIDKLDALCQRILRKTAEPMVIGGQVCHFGASIGVAMGAVAHDALSEVFINADVALYAAKSAGRSQYRMYEPQMRQEKRPGTAVLRDFRAALTNGQIICFFQPQFDATTHTLVGAEALVRWACPKRGLLLPHEFVPLADENGLTARLDEAVLDYVLAEQNRWAADGTLVPIIAMNLSAERLAQSDLKTQVDAKLKPHHRVAFELLETAFLDNLPEGIAANLDYMRAKGIRIDLDDFGSGHSSVVALQTIRPDRVKIDRLLVTLVEDNPAQLMILEALARVAELEGCGVVLEGVETEQQMAAVQSLNCDVVQGYAMGHPMSAQRFAKLLYENASNQGQATG